MVAPLLHNNDPLKFEAVKTELVQLSVTVTVGATGIAFGAAVAIPAALEQPFTVWVTEYEPLVVTVMEAVTAPVLHNKLPVYPEADKTELPQLSTTVTTGVGTTEVFGAATPVPFALVHPFTV